MCGGRSPTLAVRRRVPQLHDHREVITDRPALDDAPFDETVGEHDLAGVAAGRKIEASKRSARPLEAEVHDKIISPQPCKTTASVPGG